MIFAVVLDEKKYIYIHTSVCDRGVWSAGGEQERGERDTEATHRRAGWGRACGGTAGIRVGAGFFSPVKQTVPGLVGLGVGGFAPPRAALTSP